MLGDRYFLRAFYFAICSGLFIFSVTASGAITAGGDPGEVSPANPANWASYTTGNIGINSGKTGTLTVNFGSDLLSGSVYLGYKSGSTGYLTVTGANWTNNSALYVGYSGTGNLTISNSAYVSNTDSYMGYCAGSSGNVTVSGGLAKLANYGDLYVGYSGTGNLTIANSGQVNSYYGSSLGVNPGSTGIAIVTGAGAKWLNSSGLVVGGYGTGILTISNGAYVTSTNGDLGNNPGSTGNVTVTGNGSIWSNQSLIVGVYGTGNLNIANGGLVENTYLYIGDNANYTSYVTVTDAGSSLTNSSDLYVGGSSHITGTGNLTISNGGQVTNVNGYIGCYVGSTGNVTVTGNGSTWINNSTLYVGSSGAGDMTIANGGKVTDTYGYISTGNVTVTGTKSVWINSGNLNVGYNGGMGSMKISNGGRVINTNGYIGWQSGSKPYATVTGAGSIWTNSGNLYVGNGGAGQLTIADNGKVTAISLNINSSSSLNLNISNNNALVLGNITTVGILTNNGTINLYADSFLTSGNYTPISDSLSRNITWSGLGTYKAWGGLWNDTSKTFTVNPVTYLAAGVTGNLTTYERLLITNNGSGQQVGVSFGTITGSPTFSANLSTATEVNRLRALLTGNATVLSAWDFNSTNLGTATILLSFNIGTGMSNLTAWCFAGSLCYKYPYQDILYSTNGIASFTVENGYNGYAVTGVPVPEPCTLALLVLGSLGVLKIRHIHLRQSCRK